MTGLITILNIGTNISKFNLFSNVDGYLSAFETNIDSSKFLIGYSTNLIPFDTTIVRAMSVGDCTAYIDIVVSTTTSTSSSSTTTSTTLSTTTSTTLVNPI